MALAMFLNNTERFFPKAIRLASRSFTNLCMPPSTLALNT